MSEHLHESMRAFLRTEVLPTHDRPGDDVLEGTPERWTRALREMTRGYDIDVPALFRCFEHECNEMVIVRDVEFVSVCEHHLMPFVGRAAVGYIPAGGRVVGLSKLARVVDAYAQRLQMQERMVQQIAEAVETHLQPSGVGVVVEATHTCMSCRGARKVGARMLTCDLRGTLRDSAARSEFLSLART
jgi:GTP cyclohydrolase IA